MNFLYWRVSPLVAMDTNENYHSTCKNTWRIPWDLLLCYKFAPWWLSTQCRSHMILSLFLMLIICVTWFRICFFHQNACLYGSITGHYARCWNPVLIPLERISYDLWAASVICICAAKALAPCFGIATSLCAGSMSFFCPSRWLVITA